MYDMRKCKVCGTEFLPRTEINVFCSKTCRKIYWNKDSSRRLVKRTCNSCGKEFMGREHRIYCSVKCVGKAKSMMMGEANPNWKGGYIGLSDSRKSRARTYKSVQHAIGTGKLKPTKCEICGESGLLSIIEAHHKDLSKPFEVNWLCSSCHTRVHRAVEELLNVAI